MRYYIIAGNDPSIVSTTSNAEFISEDLDEALDVFYSDKIEKDNTEYAYLIADFESQSSTFRVYKNSPESKQLSYLILAEYNDKARNKRIYRKDTIDLITPGFKEEFSNNIEACRKFKYFYDNKIICNMIIRFKYSNGEYYICNEQQIANTNMLYNRCKSRRVKKKKFLITPLLWEQNPSILERHFTREQYELLKKKEE